MSKHTQDAAFDALRDNLELGLLLQEFARFPDNATAGDREVIAHRLRNLNSACAPLLRIPTVMVKPTRSGPTEAA